LTPGLQSAGSRHIASIEEPQRVEFSDSREIRATPETVWAALFDPEVLRRSIPGCEAMTGNAARGYTAVITQKVGPVNVTVNGRLTLSDIVEGQAVTITGEGKGGASGFAEGRARVTLAPMGSGTLLSYTMTATIGGKVASLGSRLITGFVRRKTDQFFASLQDAVEPASAAELAEAGTEAGPRRGWFRRMIGS
jgi:carbon monoxide dehydrogenase subunit G